MARHQQLPIVTTTRLEISPGREIGIHDFLRGLKRPRPKIIATLHAHDLSSLNAMAAMDHGVSVPFEPSPSELSEEQNEVLTSPTPARVYAKVQRPTNEVTEAPKIVRTYTRKAKYESPEMEPCPLFCSQSPMQGSEQLKGGLRHEPKARMDNPDNYLVYPSKRRTPLSKGNSKDNLSDLPRRRIKANEKKRRAPVNELALVPSLPIHSTSSPAAEHNRPSVVVSRAGGKGQHKEALDGSDHALRGEIENPLGQAPSNVGRSQMSIEANIGKPGTRLRKANNIPQRHSISRVGFRFPPATPKTARIPGWKLGSGFEGTKLESTGGLKATKAHRQKAHCVSHNRFQKPSIRSLELSTTILPSVQAKLCRRLSNGGLLPTGKTVLERSSRARKRNVSIDLNIPKIATLNAGFGGEAVFDKICGRATPMRALIGENDPRKSAMLSATQTAYTRPNKCAIPDERESEKNQDIRKPSKSEREGWLKRRGKVSFVIQPGQQGERHPPQEARVHSVEHIFDIHNATWYGEARAKIPQALPSRLLSKHAIQTEQITESHKSDKSKTLNYLKSKPRLGEEGRTLFDGLVTEHGRQTVRPSRSMVIDMPITCGPAPSGSNHLII